MVFEKPKRKVNKVFIHCSASDCIADDDIVEIEKLHLTPKGVKVNWNNEYFIKKTKAFKEVGYHFFITRNGTIQKGRSLEKIPAAQKGYNTNSIAICVSGLQDFRDKSFHSLIHLCCKIDKAYKNKITFHGHCEVDKNKTCPVFDYKDILELNDKGRLL